MKDDQALKQAALRILRHAGFKPENDSLQIRLLSSNPIRRDRMDRRQYVVETAADGTFILMTGPDLSDLEERARLFATHYPDLACPIITTLREKERHLLLFAYFSGTPADQALTDPGIGENTVREALVALATRLQKDERPSTPKAAREELDQFFNAVTLLPLWTNADRAFLQTIVFPHLEAHLLKSNPLRRVTNGDFILRNILVDAAGQFRVIDYEQAVDTHFFGEDWLRLGYWNRLPLSLAQLAGQQGEITTPLKVYFILKQLYWEHRFNLTPKAQADATIWCKELRRIYATETTELEHAQLWQPNPLELDAARLLHTQLFWLTDEGWSPERSICVTLAPGQNQRLLVDIPPGPTIHALRFDPSESACTLAILEITVTRLTAVPEVIFHANTAQELSRMVAAGDAFTRHSPLGDYLEVQSFGSDPQLYLSNTGVEAGVGLRCEIVLSTIPMSADLVNSLRQEVARIRSALAQRPSPADPGEKAPDYQQLSLDLLQRFGDLQARLSDTQQSADNQLRELSRQVQELTHRQESSLQGTLALENAQRLATRELQEQNAQRLASLQQTITELQTELVRLHEAAGQRLIEQENARRAAEQENHHQNTQRLGSLQQAITELQAELPRRDEADAHRLAEQENARLAAEQEQRRLVGALASVKASLLAAESRVARQHEYLASHARTIDRLELAQRDRDAVIATLTKEISRQHDALEQAQRHAHHSEDQLGRLAQELASATATIVSLQAALQEAGERTALLTEKLSGRVALEHRQAQLLEELETERGLRQRMLGSLSWRLMAPFRTFFAWFAQRNR